MLIFMRRCANGSQHFLTLIRSIKGNWKGDGVLSPVSCTLHITISAFQNGSFKLSGYGSNQQFKEMGKSLGVTPPRTMWTVASKEWWRRAATDWLGK